MKQIGTVLFLCACICGIVVAVFGPLGITVFVATNEATAATTTGMSPTVGHTCNCVPPDILKSLEQMGVAVNMLTNQLNAAEAREADAQATLAEARAEIERLKVENNKFRELTTTLREIIVR